MKSGIMDLITLFFMGALLVLIVTHSSGFSQSFGAVTGGVNMLGNTLTGASIGGGSGTSTSRPGL